MAKFEKETSPLIRLDKKGGFDLWQEHCRSLRSWDDLMMARWLNQMLEQLSERCWRASHPLAIAYRLGATVAHQRDLWNRRLLAINSAYQRAPCCGSALIPFVSFEVCTHGIYCSCCGESLLTINQLKPELAVSLQSWDKFYSQIHQVAHWNEFERGKCADYDKALDQACEQAVPLLTQLGYQLAPRFLGDYPVVFWEDADHCLEIFPEDILPPAE